MTGEALEKALLFLVFTVAEFREFLRIISDYAALYHICGSRINRLHRATMDNETLVVTKAIVAEQMASSD
ncbi:hypothetical protein OK344_01120 [Kaistella sp. BT6-1-3]|uniref:Uncharacterized protein n=1 Tax=Kaistella yananensis TaxID=2989820 RepID=A0ABT3JJB9_9FLAO|nr:hypothetical protein [Kaistella yananensis]MCW4450806.1 hypothetical protein [Kaistella yananensis]